MKITLFFCAGLYAEELGLSKVSQLAGVGRRMPLTTAAFTVAALGMIGLPPLAGFVSKWALGVGGLEAAQPWVVAVLLTSTMLNAAYFLPVIVAMWTKAPVKAEADGAAPDLTDPVPEDELSGEGAGGEPVRRLEAPAALLLPALATAVFVVGLGVAAGWEYSPWSIAKIIADGAWP